MARSLPLLLTVLVILTVAAAAATAAGVRGAPGDAPAPPHARAEGRTAGARSGPAIGTTGTYRSPSGETVRVALAPAYGRNDAVVRSWGAMVSGLVHGPELRTVTVYVAPADQVRRECGGVACYDPHLRYLIVPGSDPGDGHSLAEVVAHEYGHHIAASRSNPPWDSYEWGTKRWASYEDVCARTRAGQLFPGAEGAHYARNPGEAFAETYRVLNGGHWSGVADASLAPDATSLRLLREDIVRPWRGPRALVRHGTAPARLRIETALDGRLTATAAGRRLAIRDAVTGRALARGAGRARATICGQDAVTIEVGGRGPFALRVAVP